jgi:hypothetical protein
MSGQQPPPEISPEDRPQTLGGVHLFAFYVFGTAAGWDRERCEREAKWAWPLTYYKARGIPMGKQWAVLGWLACRYARDFTVDGLYHELREVVAASPNNPRLPWRERQVYDIARRAKRFIERDDARLDDLLSHARRWLGRSGL